MTYNIKTELFEGPLALLLKLIEQEKLDITAVSLSHVADQYLMRIDELGDQLPTAELADFLVIAGRLLVIKSRALLPNLEIEEEDETDLEYQLRMYKAYRDAAEKVRMLIAEKHFSYGRLPHKVIRTASFAPPKGFTAARGASIMHALIANLEKTIQRLPQKKMQAVISLGERIAHLRDLIKKSNQFAFHDFLKSARNRAEVVVSFLALLEMIKQRELIAEQAGHHIHVSALAL